MKRTDLGYELPPDRIAQKPTDAREDARLLLATSPLRHHQIHELAELLPPSLWVFNDTRVLPARLLGFKATGGQVEILLVEPLEVQDEHGQRWIAMTRPAKTLKPGTELTFSNDSKNVHLRVKIAARRPDGKTEVELESTLPLDETLEAVGHPPLPPYIDRKDEAFDRERYQTVFARNPGAIAAPTAGLHFTQALLDRLKSKGHRLTQITLHVGPGTFAPLREENLDEHPMHSERFSVSEEAVQAIETARADGLPVMAVGTTVVRTLEASAAANGRVQAGEQRTNLFIYPPYEFKIIDGLLTNFHLPYSTLLALVMAKLGVDETRAAYNEAINEKYRFFSYGDAMLIPPG